ncbi:YdcF family protein [Kitasatospora sp. NPDC096147]|uniref:YdcF family protein n=1 Tax=Kitasatospora sp. NPDC096147 TaxID=3364093 RepID=UPI00382282AF
MYAFLPALVFFLAFCTSVWQDRRRFRNAVLLGLTLTSLAAALVAQARHLPDTPAMIVYAAVLLVPALGVLVLGAALVLNGVTVVRKEGARPATLLSLLLGLAIYAMVALVLLAGRPDASSGYLAFVVAVLLLSAYLSFLCLSFLGYAWLYGRIPARGEVDYVVVLGAGLIDGERVPPLLAARLRRGLAVHDRQVGKGRPAPVLLASGGKGTDEKLPESTAMAAWLVENGAPSENVREEDQSRTTEENLILSHRIMSEAVPDYRCVVVTNNFHAYRAAMLARRAGVNGQVRGAPTAGYYLPSATIREFVAVFWEHKVVNLTICALLVGMPLGAFLLDALYR